MSAITNTQIHTTFTVFDRKRAEAKAQELRDEAFETLMAAVRASETKRVQSDTAEQDAPLPGMPLTSMPSGNLENGAVSDSMFAYWANILPTDDRFHVGNGIYQYSSRCTTLMEDYKAWKSTQAPMDLPAESCTEAEKLAWMREHYSGELGPFELVDAIETMHDLKLMDWYERECVFGGKCNIRVIKVESTTLVTGKDGVQRHIITDPKVLEALAEIAEAFTKLDGNSWSDHFDKAPLHQLHTLEDLENWLGDFRTKPIADWEVKRREYLAQNGITQYYSVPV